MQYSGGRNVVVFEYAPNSKNTTTFGRPSGFFLLILLKFREKSKKATTFGMTTFRPPLYYDFSRSVFSRALHVPATSSTTDDD